MNPLLHILLTLLLFTSLDTSPWSASAAAATDTLTAGQALAFGDKLVSRNGKFALGFFRPTAVISKSRNITSPNWYLGIWFNKIPVFTTVWVANREAPIADSKRKQTHLKISSDGNNFIIVTQASPETETIVWATPTPSANRSGASLNTTTTAVLLDSGNLALLELESPSSSNVSYVPLWQSFDYPTDVVLPGAKFGRNKVTGFSRRAITWKSLIDPGLGSYSVEIDTTGVVLKHRSLSVVYWHWSSSSTSTLKLIPILKSRTGSTDQRLD